MSRLTPEQRAEKQAELEALLRDDDDDDDEYEVGFPEGGYVRGRHSRVSKVAAARGFKLEPDPEPEENPQGGKPKGKGGTIVEGRGFGRRLTG